MFEVVVIVMLLLLAVLQIAGSRRIETLEFLVRAQQEEAATAPPARVERQTQPFSADVIKGVVREEVLPFFEESERFDAARLQQLRAHIDAAHAQLLTRLQTLEKGLDTIRLAVTSTQTAGQLKEHASHMSQLERSQQEIQQMLTALSHNTEVNQASLENKLERLQQQLVVTAQPRITQAAPRQDTSPPQTAPAARVAAPAARPPSPVPSAPAQVEPRIAPVKPVEVPPFVAPVVAAPPIAPRPEPPPIPEAPVDIPQVRPPSRTPELPASGIETEDDKESTFMDTARVQNPSYQQRTETRREWVERLVTKTTRSSSHQKLATPSGKKPHHTGFAPINLPPERRKELRRMLGQVYEKCISSSGQTSAPLREFEQRLSAMYRYDNPAEDGAQSLEHLLRSVGGFRVDKGKVTLMAPSPDSKQTHR